MERFYLPVWNGLFFGKERKIVLKLNHINGYDIWIAVYDLKKHLSGFNLQEFIKPSFGHFCIIKFKYKSGTDLLEDGFLHEHFEQLDVYYTSEKEQILDYLDSLNIDEKQFTYPWKVDFPMGW